jgi:hypothetical protein
VRDVARSEDRAVVDAVLLAIGVLVTVAVCGGLILWILGWYKPRKKNK